MVTVDIEQLIIFYDHNSDINRKDSNSVSAIAGEELGFALLCHYFKSIGGKPKCVSPQCKGSGNKGHRLDGWLFCDGPSINILYQVETKNWSAHSLSGRELLIDSSPEDLIAFRKERWFSQWKYGNFKYPGVVKVLEKMNPPDAYSNCSIKPLLCYWYVIHPEGKDEPLFEYRVENPNPDCYDTVEIFSMSAYLRRLFHQGTKQLNLEMPTYKRRLHTLGKIFRVH